MTTRKLCVGCSEDFAKEGFGSFCYACGLEHERSVALSGNPYGGNHRNNSAVQWWGAVAGKGVGGENSEMVDGEDLQTGFQVEDEYGRPINDFSLEHPEF